jgi:hypothetical protein
MKRVTLASLMIVVILGVAAIMPVSHSKAQDNAKDQDNAKEEKVETRAVGERGLLLKNLRLYSPVPVHGPYPYLLYTANVGDLVQLQVSYPISPPFPRSITVRYYPEYLRFVDLVETEGQVVVVPPPQEGGVGNGYYSIFLKPVRNGRTHITVIVEFENGDIEEVPFAFSIGNERKLMAPK